MKISNLRVSPFPPFAHFDLLLPHLEGSEVQDMAEVHAFTGPNGSGKTRLLALVAEALGGGRELAKREISTRDFLLFEGVATEDDGFTHNAPQDLREKILIPRSGTPAMTLCPRAYLESAEVKANAEIRQPSRDDALSFSRPSDESQRLLQGVFTMDLQAATEARQGGDGRYSRMIRAIEQAVQDVTGLKFNFVSTVHPKPELRVRWGDSSASFAITTLPDGLRSILGWLVQGVVWMDVFWDQSPNPLEEPVILLVDEPETHLHPEWQWRVMPMMQRLFPKAQIFVATHSPFIVSSLNENAWIHRLVVGEGGAVTLEDPQEAEKGDSYATALSSILGVRDWFDPENRQLLAEFHDLRRAALRGEEGKEQAMHVKAEEIAERGMELEQIVGAELRQYERQKKQRAESNAMVK
jgi:predicted ATP-binding protein involved in virulence